MQSDQINELMQSSQTKGLNVENIGFNQNVGFNQEENPEILEMSETYRSTRINQILAIQHCAEKAEARLSYGSSCKSEHERKKSGSYYTPTDVADFFWREFFIQNEIPDAETAISFLNKYHFIEPACGAGALIFSFLRQLTNLGATPEQLAKIEISVIDININALDFTEQKTRTLANLWNITFKRINFICGNFLETKFNNDDRPCFFFGNPPFVANEKGRSSWKNIYADFLEKALKQTSRTGSIHFIVPLSIAFSRDYSSLRKMITDTGGTIRLSNFDNIPDTLFKSGKPEHTNTNKANSQRCTILTILPERPKKLLSTPLLRWAGKDRSNLLGQSPEYLDVSDYGFDQQFPRPENQSVMDYLELAAESPRLGTLVTRNGGHTLFVTGVARNYISFREEPGNGVHTLNFNNERNFLLGLGILSSDLFFSYWRSLGDGFHLTKGNILGFPLHYKLVRECERNAPEICRIWKTRRQFRKEKLNSGRITRSFDLGNVVPSLVNHLPRSIVKCDTCKS